MRDTRNAHRALMERPEGKGPRERPRRRWENTIKTAIKGIGLERVDLINPLKTKRICFI
jgi:hypothetical protein